MDLRYERESPTRSRSLIGASGRSILRLLTTEQRNSLTKIGSRVIAPARTIFYSEDTPATDIYICISGAARSFRMLRNGGRRIQVFLFAEDVFGLAEDGRYLNSVQAIVPSTVLRLPRPALAALLLSDPDLEFQFLCKVTYELREAQRRSIVLTRRDAAGRLAMFLIMLARMNPRESTPNLIDVPMSRIDIADYLGLTPEAVSRATRRLKQHGVISFDDRHRVRVLDRKRLDELASAT